MGTTCTVVADERYIASETFADHKSRVHPHSSLRLYTSLLISCFNGLVMSYLVLVSPSGSLSAWGSSLCKVANGCALSPAHWRLSVCLSI